MLDIVVDTDLGHDPDDLFTLLWLHAVGYNIRAIALNPGDPDQIALARFLVEELSLDCAVGVSHLDRTKPSSGGVHHWVLDKFGRSKNERCLVTGAAAFLNARLKYPNCSALVIGPATNMGRALESGFFNPKELTMQGGFCPYLLHSPEVREEKFTNVVSAPTFNFNGDRKAVAQILAAPMERRLFVGKNVCHTLVYDKYIHSQLLPKEGGWAGELFQICMNKYLEKHGEKKFHDPLAATLHQDPNMGTWLRATPEKLGGEWTTSYANKDSLVLVDVDREKFWYKITSFKTGK